MRPPLAQEIKTTTYKYKAHELNISLVNKISLSCKKRLYSNALEKQGKADSVLILIED